jgi:hypothetical protein
VGATAAAAFRRRRGTRIGLLAAVVAVIVLAIAATVLGAYLPLYQLSAAVRAD